MEQVMFALYAKFAVGRTIEDALFVRTRVVTQRGDTSESFPAVINEKLNFHDARRPRRVAETYGFVSEKGGQDFPRSVSLRVDYATLNSRYNCPPP